MEDTKIDLDKFKTVDWKKTWMRHGIGAHAGVGDCLGNIKGTKIDIYMSWRAVQYGGPAFFKHGTETDWVWKKIPTDQIDDVVDITNLY